MKKPPTGSLTLTRNAYRENQQRADQLESQMKALLEAHYPHLLEVYGVKTITASQLAVTAGGNPQRIHNEAAFASLCGAAPIPASSGKTNRHRLNRGGDRRGNSALHRIALVRMRHDPTTRAYVERRLGENKTKKEIIRCLKRAIAREVYKILTRPHEAETTVPDGAELCALRKTRNATLSDAARALGTWPARISDIEKHHRPLPDIANRYRPFAVERGGVSSQGARALIG
ncbi:IS110 family transposase [Nesterenkonia sp. MY13]|uniref:IS110 family transposase n=1 Tax=Nesterenkonia sedimenti TaxID=1463632 RepID=A0A7X8TM49_9MICC|nr:IS110 family transposase [Nesterenkonia sedimenti]